MKNNILSLLLTLSFAQSQAHSNNEEAVIMLNGTSMITAREFAEKLNGIYDARPGIQIIIAEMPANKQIEVFGQIAEGILNQRLIIDYVKNRNLLDNKAVARAHEQLDLDLAVSAFGEEVTEEVTLELQAMVKNMSNEQTQELIQKIYTEKMDALKSEEKAEINLNCFHQFVMNK